MRLELTAVFHEVPEGYIGWIEELPGACTQGTTLDDARANLNDAVLLLIDTYRERTTRETRDMDTIRETLIIEEADPVSHNPGETLISR